MQIAQIVNLPENIAITTRSINQSKGKKDPERWLEEENQIGNGMVKADLVNHAIQKAKAAIERKASELA